MRGKTTTKQDMQADHTTFVALLKACAKMKDLCKGTRVHAQLLQRGLLQKCSSVSDALVIMYAKCGALAKAKELLHELLVQNVFPWTALILGYAQLGQSHNALACFEHMQREGVSPSAVTFSCILKACGSLGARDKGELIHDEISKQGLLADDIVLGTALVDMYAKCGALEKAQWVLEELPNQDVFSWTALIAGYAQQGQSQDALNCFEQMQRKGLSPDAATFACILKACGSIGAVDKGEQIHDEIARQGLGSSNAMLGNALVDMYAKCGCLVKAQQVLEKLAIQNVVSWNALLTGYAQEGQGEQALNCFERMQRKGLFPDAVTLLCILKACGVTGLVNDAQMYFMSVGTKYGIKPDLRHYTSMVDAFGRAGHLDKAIGLIHKFPSFDYSIAFWSALLGACKKWGDKNVGRWAFECALRVDKSDVAG